MGTASHGAYTPPTANTKDHEARRPLTSARARPRRISPISQTWRTGSCACRCHLAAASCRLHAVMGFRHSRWAKHTDNIVELNNNPPQSSTADSEMIDSHITTATTRTLRHIMHRPASWKGIDSRHAIVTCHGTFHGHVDLHHVRSITRMSPAALPVLVLNYSFVFLYFVAAQRLLTSIGPSELVRSFARSS